MANIPSNIGRYEIVKAIGHGGMGSLYLAWDAKLERAIAIKVLKDDNDDLRERFAREAKSAARLRHPNIVTIFDLGEHEGQPYIAMEYIHGRTLAQIIRERDDMPLGRTLELMAELCDGLAFAHKAGIIHRDVKPANIMVDEQGSLKILDFGIARLAESAGMTQAGMMIGTLNYMSPEQITGLTVDHRSDIFAVGLVFYELLAQKEAFPGTLSTGILAKLLHSEPVPLAQACPGLDEDVIRIVGRAIEKDVNRRYQDLTQMRRAILTVRGHVEAGDGLTRVRDTPAPHVPPLKSPSERRALERGEIAQRRASQIQQYLDQADRAIREERYDSAIVACEHLLMLDAENARALDLVDRARAAIEARQAKQLLSQAARDLHAGSLTIAAERIDQAGLLQPSAEQEELREEVERARVARQADAEEKRADAVIRDARQRFAKGDRAGALSLLDDFTPANESVLKARAALRAEAERIDEQRRADTAAARAKADEARRQAQARAERAAREQAAREQARRDREPPASEPTLARPSGTAEPAELTLRTVPLPTRGARPTARPAPQPEPEPQPERSSPRGGMIATAAVAVILLAGGAYYWFGPFQPPAATPTPRADTSVAQPLPPAPSHAPSAPPIDPQVTRANEFVSEGRRLLDESKLGQARASFQQAQALAATQAAQDGLAEIDRRQTEYTRLWQEGTAAADQKRTKDALSKLVEARAIDPETFQSSGGPGIVDRLQGQLSASERDRTLSTAAAAETKRLDASRKASIALFNEGQKFEQLRRHDAADANYREALAADRNNTEAAAALARSDRYRKAKDSGLAAFRKDQFEPALVALRDASLADRSRFLADGLDRTMEDINRRLGASPRTPAPTDDKSAIEAVLQALSNALSTETNRSREIGVVRRVWPSASGDVFGDSESQTYRLSKTVFVEIGADKASVDCDRARAMTPGSTGKTNIVYDNVRIELIKRNGAWQVNTIRERSK